MEGREGENKAVHTHAISIHAGSSNAGSIDAPPRYSTQDVRYADTAETVRRRTRVAGGV